MSISEIAAVLGVSKSYLYGLVKAYPAEKPKLKGDLDRGRHSSTAIELNQSVRGRVNRGLNPIRQKRSLCAFQSISLKT